MIIVMIVFIYSCNAVVAAVSKCNARCLFFEGGYYNCKIITKGVKNHPIMFSISIHCCYSLLVYVKQCMYTLLHVIHSQSHFLGCKIKLLINPGP